MFRRSRFSVRPNVVTGGRTTTGTPQEPPVVNQEVNESQKESGESSSAAAVADKSDLTPTENTPATGNGNDQNGEGTSSSASLQRRKRFSIKPKVAPGRPPAISRMPKSPVKAATATPADISSSDTEKPSTSGKAGLQALNRRRLSETSKQHKVQPKPTPVSAEISGPSCVSLADDSPEQTHSPADSSKQTENISGSPVKEVPPRQPDRVAPSLPDKEATEVAEKAKSLISSKNVVSMPQSALSLSRLLNDPSDVQRLIKAQKLRELLRQERCKERKLKKTKARQKEFTLDPTKMTMRDLIHYLPTSNPMPSSLEDSSHENESVCSVSLSREKSPERAQQPEVSPAKSTSREEEAEEENAEEEQEESLMVPQVKVAEDGSLIIDEESLTVEVQRAKGPNPAQDREPIFERGSTTTYSSFRKANYTKPWSIEETDMFFLAVSMVGTDFSMICQLFPHRARLEIKNKFKKEERENSWRIDKAFREKRKLDIEFFSKLLEKILEVQKNRKKLKLLAEKNATKKIKTKTKRKKSTKKLSDVEEEDENEAIESEDGGEKENEEQLNEGGVPIPASEPKKKRIRKKKAEALTEEPSDKRTRTGEAAVAEDSEQVLPEDHTKSDRSENAQNAAKDTAIKPAKLSRGRAPKPVLPLGLKRGKKAPPSRKEEEAASDKGEKSTRDEASKEQGNKEELGLIGADGKKSDDVSSEEEETVVTLLKPTRYGRVPKPTKPLIYPSPDDLHSSGSENTPAKPKARCSVKRANLSKPQSDQMSKKPKLITLRSSKSDFSDDGSEKEDKGGREEQQLTYSSSGEPEASMFMTSNLDPHDVVVSEVDESIVELDILDSMPDVLGISQDALCPDSSCQTAQHETGTSEPCEHQLDLLVDVIDFLSSEHTEDSQDESYNEAAQTLLTIGSLIPATLSAQNQMVTQDCTTESTPAAVDESSHPEEELVSAALEQSSTFSLSPTLDQEIAEISQSVATVELQSSVTDGTQSKPKHGQMSRTSQQISQTETPKEQTVNEIVPKKTDSAQKLIEGNISLTEIKPTVESSVTQSCSSSVSQFEHRDAKTSDSRDNDETTDSGLIKPSTSNSALTDAVQEPYTVSDPFQESSDKHLPCASPPEDLPASQKGEGDVATPSQSRGSRMQKLKPKPNLPGNSRAARNKSQVEKDSPPTLKPEFLKLTVEEVEPQPTFSLSTGFKPTEELPVNKEIKTHVENANQGVLDVSRSYPSAVEKQNISEDQLSGEQATRDAKSTSHFTDKSLTSHAGTTEKCCKAVGLTDPTVTEPLAGQGLNADLNVIQEGNDNPTTFITSAEEKTVNKVESEVAATSKLKRGRLQKIKPKPNVPQTSRGTRAKPQTTEETAGKHSNVEFNIKTIEEVDQQRVFNPSSQIRIQSTDCSSSLNSALMSDSSLTPTEKLPSNEEETTLVEPVDQMDVEEASDRSVVENTNLTEAQPEQSKTQAPLDSGSNSELTDKNTTSLGETSERDSSTATTAVDSGGIESKIGSSILDSAPVQEQRTVEDSAIAKQDCEGASTRQSRIRLAKIKPKPNLLQTSRSAKLKPQTTEKQSSPGPDPESHKNPLEDEPQATCSFSAEEQAVNTDSASENQNLEVQLEPCGDQANRDAEKQFKDLNLTSCVGESGNSCDNIMLTEQIVTQLQGDQGSSGHPAASVAPSEELCVSQEKETTASTCQLRRSRSQKIKPKPNLPQSSRTTKFKHQQVPKEGLIEDSGPSLASGFDNRTTAEVEPQPLIPEKPSEYTGVGPDVKVDLGSVATDQGTSKNQNLSQVQPEPSFEQGGTEMDANPVLHVGASEMSLNDMETSDKSKAQVEAHPTSPPEKSVKDNSLETPLVSVPSLKLASSREEELSSTEEQLIPNVGQVSSSDGAKQSTLQRRQRFSKVKPKPNLGSASRVTRRKNPSDDGAASINQHVDASSAGTAGQKSNESDKDNASNHVPVETNLASSGDGKLDVSTESQMSQTVTDVQSTVKETTSNSSSIPHETGSSVQRADQIVSKLTDATETTKNAPQARRGRLIKPKPNLRRSSRPQLSQQEQSTTEADSSGSSQGMDVSVEHKPLTEPRPEDQEPVEGDKQSHKDSSLNDAHPSSGCVTQMSGTQNESTSSAEGIQSYSLLSQILPAEVPSDPDEPFFVLSLTEIPVSSAGEVTNEASHLPVTDLSTYEQRVPAENLEAARDGSALNVLVHTSPKESGVEISKNTFPSSIHEAPSSLLTNDPNDEQGNSKARPPQVPETTESNETETLQSKQTRKGKLQGKSTATRKKRTSAAASLTGSEPKASDKTFTKPQEGSGLCADADKEALTGEREPDSCSESQTARGTRGSRQCRNPRDFPPFVSETNISPTSKPPSRKAACKKTKETTPSPAAKASSSKPKVSASGVVPTKSFSQPSSEVRSTSLKSPDVEKDRTSDHGPGCSVSAPSVQRCTAEASTSLEDDCAESTSAEEEPTSVSQYFLSDIFTEVEHG